MLSLYPIHFFFQTLYYTDVGSLFWTLLTHELVMPMPKQALPARRIIFAGATGCVAVLFRQTNAVWLMFTFGTAALNDLQSSKWGVTLSQRHVSPMILLTFCKALLMESKRLLWRLGFILVPVMLFLGFVVQNGSIVVGDHSNHQVAAHWSQLAYLSAVTAATSGFGFGSAVSMSSLKAFAADCFGSCRSVLLLLASLALTAYVLHQYSLATSIPFGRQPPLHLLHLETLSQPAMVQRSFGTSLHICDMVLLVQKFCSLRTLGADLVGGCCFDASASTIARAPLLDHRCSHGPFARA